MSGSESKFLFRDHSVYKCFVARLYHLNDIHDVGLIFLASALSGGMPFRSLYEQCDAFCGAAKVSYKNNRDFGKGFVSSWFGRPRGAICL